MRRAIVMLMAVTACLGPQDDASMVHDLRVIGASFSPPEIMAPTCQGIIGTADAGAGAALAVFASFAAPVQLKWLVQDPGGEGRAIGYTLRACTSTGDLDCDDDGGFVQLAEGTMQPGELTQTFSLGSQFLSGSLTGFLSGDGGTPLLFEVINRDAYKGLGGIRVPVVLHVTAGLEAVYAQKLMVYSCKLLPGQAANVQPVIPGLTANGRDWPESLDGGPTITLRRDEGELEFEPNDFSALEEDYVVPSLMLKPVNLKESWKFAWHTSLGKMSSPVSGGTDFTGMLNKAHSSWQPRAADGGTASLVETDVDFWIIVRDGRGGESWLTRKAHLIP